METKYDPKYVTFKLDYSDHIVPIEQVRKQVIDAMVRDKETKIKQVLIELGWTPPKEGKHISELSPSTIKWELLKSQT